MTRHYDECIMPLWAGWPRRGVSLAALLACVVRQADAEFPSCRAGIGQDTLYKGDNPISMLPHRLGSSWITRHGGGEDSLLGIWVFAYPLLDLVASGYPPEVAAYRADRITTFGREELLEVYRDLLQAKSTQLNRNSVQGDRAYTSLITRHDLPHCCGETDLAVDAETIRKTRQRNSSKRVLDTRLTAALPIGTSFQGELRRSTCHNNPV